VPVGKKPGAPGVETTPAGVGVGVGGKEREVYGYVDKGEGIGDPLEQIVLVSPLSSLPGCQVEKYIGLVALHVIKETTALKHFEVFYHEFVTDALCMARSHVLAIGGNALLGYRINNLFLTEEKHQAYAVLNICGDAVRLSPSPNPLPLTSVPALSFYPPLHSGGGGANTGAQAGMSPQAEGSGGGEDERERFSVTGAAMGDG